MRESESSPDFGPTPGLAMRAEPVAIEAAWRWIDANAPTLEVEEVELAAAMGRVPATVLSAAADVPARACALETGYAVRADETVGAAPYNPLSCLIKELGVGTLPRGTVARVGAGQPLPAGADAVLPEEAVEPEGDDRIGVLAPVAEGDGVVMAASELRAGDPLWPAAGRRQPLRPAGIGLLGAAGALRVPVVRRPRTRILIEGALEVLGPMLEALVARDGGAVIGVGRLEPGQAAADLVAGADVVLIAGSVEGLPGAIAGRSGASRSSPAARPALPASGPRSSRCCRACRPPASGPTS